MRSGSEQEILPYLNWLDKLRPKLFLNSPILKDVLELTFHAMRDLKGEEFHVRFTPHC